MSMNVNSSSPSILIDSKKVSKNEVTQSKQGVEATNKTASPEQAKSIKDSNQTTKHKSHVSNPAVATFPSPSSKKLEVTPIVSHNVGDNKLERKASPEKLKVGDTWNGGKVTAVNVDPTGYRNVSKGIEGGVFDTKFSSNLARIPSLNPKD